MLYMEWYDACRVCGNGVYARVYDESKKLFFSKLLTMGSIESRTKLNQYQLNRKNIHLCQKGH